MEPKGYELLKI